MKTTLFTFDHTQAKYGTLTTHSNANASLNLTKQLIHRSKATHARIRTHTKPNATRGGGEEITTHKNKESFTWKLKPRKQFIWNPYLTSSSSSFSFSFGDFFAVFFFPFLTRRFSSSHWDLVFLLHLTSTSFVLYSIIISECRTHIRISIQCFCWCLSSTPTYCTFKCVCVCFFLKQIWWGQYVHE